jgi:hypothetical protein
LFKRSFVDTGFFLCSRFTLVRALKAVVPVAAALVVAGSLLFVSGALDAKTAKVTGTIYTCSGAFGKDCRAEATGGITIEFTQLGLVSHTFRAASQTNGTYAIQLPSGRYAVNLPSCRTYPFRASNIRYLGPPNFLREDWTISSDGSCGSATPLMQNQ